MTNTALNTELKNSIELASGGNQTVIFTASGQPSFMNVIRQKTLGDLYPTIYPGDSTVHPAFVIGTKKLSKIYIGTYWGAVKNGELVSQPGTPSNTSIVTNTAVKAAVSSGSGHHLLTWSEAALIRGLSNAASWNPWAADKSGSANKGSLTALRIDGGIPGDTSTPSAIYSGSGPEEFRHDNSFTGISDIFTGGYGVDHPNIYGVRIWYGEIQFLVGNVAATITDPLVFGNSSLDARWMALDGTNGNFISPTYTTNNGVITVTTMNSVRTAKSGTSSVYGQTTTLPANTLSNAGEWWDSSSMNYNLSTAALKILQMYGLVKYGSEGSYTKSPGNGGVGTVFFDDLSNVIITKATFALYTSIFGYAWTDGTDMSGIKGMIRPCYYDNNDLS